MNFQLGDTQKVAFSITELDADGNPTSGAAGDSITVSSSDTDSITVVMDETPIAGSQASGFLVGGKKVQEGVVVTAVVTHADGTSLSAADVIDVIAGAAASLSIGLGAPISQ